MDQNAFLHTICAHPDDDAPRLVYADWLDERGDPLGEFIRVQVELGKIKPSHPRSEMLRARQLELMLAHVPTWVQPHGMQILGAEFKRGFMCVGTVDANTLLDDQAWFERWPWEVLRFGNAHWDFITLLNWPPISRLKLLDLSESRLHDHQLLAMTRSENLKHGLKIELGNQPTMNEDTATRLQKAFGGRIRWRLRPLDMFRNGDSHGE
jgi:uncharacterized protein (TIGR02996 family)